ncbi:MAG: HEAT repeat domain-containing protein [Planctomycetes bacterium]|nr:HEAT repeat domain-containing protein [Planctomycetota bacterium]
MGISFYTTAFFSFTLIGGEHELRYHNSLNPITIQDRTDTTKIEKIEALIDKLHNNDIKIRQDTALELAQLWNQPDAVSILKSKYELFKNTQPASILLKDVIERIKFREILGQNIVDHYADKIDRLYYNDRLFVEGYDDWITNPIKYKLTDQGKLNHIAEYISSKIAEVNAKRYFIDCIAGHGGLFRRSYRRHPFDETNMKILIGFLGNGDEQSKAEAIVHLYSCTESKEYAKEIASSLKSPTERVREYAILTLERVNAQSFASKIASLLNDKSSSVTARAIHALMVFNAKEYSDQIATKLSENSECVRESAVKALNKFNSVKYINDLAKLLDDQEQNSHVYTKAAIVIARLGGKEYLNKIEGLFKKEKNTYSKASLALALGYLGSTSNKKEIAELLTYDDKAVSFA